MIKPLTSLRFFFAFIVFLSHMRFLQECRTPALGWLFLNYFQEGAIGVSFFFLLSGYILAYTYQDKVVREEVPMKDFYVARMARVYPMYLFSIFISIYFTLGELLLNDTALWFKKFFLSIFMVQSFIPANYSYYAFNPPNWSISTEAFFYLMFPLLALIAASRSWFKALLLLAMLAAVPIGMQFISGHKMQFGWFYINPLLRIVDFSIGIAVYNVSRYLNPAFFSRKYMATSLEAGSLLLLGGFILVHNEVAQVYRYSCFYWLPMSMVILVFSFQRGRISKLLSGNAFILLGEISFAFYLIHWQVVSYFARANEKVLHIQNEYVMVLIIFLISLAGSYLCFRFIEKPMNKYIRKRFTGRSIARNPIIEQEPELLHVPDK